LPDRPPYFHEPVKAVVGRCHQEDRVGAIFLELPGFLNNLIKAVLDAFVDNGECTKTALLRAWGIIEAHLGVDTQ
jgi:hypothetical protein